MQGSIDIRLTDPTLYALGRGLAALQSLQVAGAWPGACARPGAISDCKVRERTQVCSECYLVLVGTNPTETD